MKMRVFRVKVQQDRMAAYQRLVQQHSVPWLATNEGLLAYYMGEPLGPDRDEFLVATLWQDLQGSQGLPAVCADETVRVEEMVADHSHGP